MSRFSRKARATSCTTRAPAPRWMLVAAFLLLGIMALALAYRVMFPSQQRGAFERFFNGGEEAVVQHKLVFMHMDGCGWCVRFKPEWDAFAEQNSAALKKSGITMLSYERKQPEAKAYDNYVDGYPTVLLDTGGVVVKFAGKRTPEGIAEFLRENGVTFVKEGFYEEPPTGMETINSGVSKANDSQKEGSAKKALEQATKAGSDPKSSAN